MQLTIGFVLSALAATASAHATIYGVHVNGVDQGDGRNVYIRSPPNNNPVKDVSSTGIICNVNNRSVARSVTVPAGATYTVEWYHDNRGDDIIAASHKGPHTFYIAPASSNGSGAVWTKLCEEGLSGGTWAVDRIIANKGKISCTIPSCIAPGNYLIRAEIIAHHESETNYRTNPARGAQFYPSCAQVTITGSGTTSPNQGYNFQTGYTPTDPGILFNLYGGATSYSIPGPRPWTCSGGGTTNPNPDPQPQPTSTPAPVNPQPTQGGGGSGTVNKWGQCGGIGYNGPTQCVGSTCTVSNPYYSQCL